ncbi:MAG: hypothetical protein AAGK22_01605 [Acidobacteriota bacterium]
MKRIGRIALAALVLGGPVLAEVGTLDAVPAATLLIPRFEVDLVDPTGYTTLFSVNNASAAPTIAHVTVWSEWSVPVLDFDIYLTGYDVQTINLGDILRNGVLPQTGPDDALSNRGPWSEAHDTFGGSCLTNSPNYAPISGTFLAVVQEALTGQPLSAGAGAGLCSSTPGDETLARGFITIDNVSECSQEFPNNDGYFADGGTGTANNDNVLWGDFFLCDPGNAFTQGFTAVHLEADSTRLAAGAPSCDPVANYELQTFYCRTQAGVHQGGGTALPGEDNREATGSTFASRYVTGAGFSGGTSLVVWRDNGVGSPASCATGAPSFSQTELVVFDEEENPTVAPTGGPSGAPGATPVTPFPYCTNRTVVGVDFPVDAPFGWVYANLNDASTGGAFDFNQAYGLTVMDASGLYSVGFEAIQLNNLTTGSTTASNPLITP